MLGVGELLQIDATVIAGILILLTIDQFAQTQKLHKKLEWRWRNHGIEFTPYSVVSVIVVPFSLSAICLILFDSFSSVMILDVLAIATTIVGFAIVIWVVMTLAWIEDQQSRNKNNNNHNNK